jgi:hypothetical protein
MGIWGGILGIALTIQGVGLLVGTRYGRARWLLWLALPLAFLTFATVTVSRTGTAGPPPPTATAIGAG